MAERSGKNGGVSAAAPRGASKMARHRGGKGFIRRLASAAAAWAGENKNS